MRIGIDARCLQGGNKSGVEEYTLNILENLFQLDKKNDYVLFLNSLADPKVNLDNFKKYPNVQIKIFRWPNKLLNFLFWYVGWPRIDKLLGGVDLFFLPNINFGAFSRKTKLLLTVHDLSFEHYPETFSWQRRLWHTFINPQRLCRRAQKIIAVSNSTRQDILTTYRIAPEKVELIHSAADEKYAVIDRNEARLLAIKNKYHLPFRFILYLGTIEPRKNIIGIVRAYNQLRQIKNSETDKYKLVIAGSRGWKDKKIFAEIQKSSYRQDIIFCGFICDVDKPLVYNLAALFVYPSLFEGFGFPPLEAMACGVPVIAANNSSLPEIVGKAGILIDPDKPDEIFQALREVLNSKELQSTMKKNGLAQARKFSWRQAAAKLLILLESFS